ncbi:MAG: MlaD family protein [Treponema sp.]|jgi:phospholipid/cholesterol/gamma-HCH transport system substrate-binding protein|nr:MlaD family protein [Treponema sp.]
MKFRIRYADQVVGIFIVVALLSLTAVIFLLGKSQRWFSRNYSFVTYAVSASGLNKNMPVSYKGFTIGNVKSVTLTGDNRVEVVFTVHDEYRGRVKQGSLVQIVVSPIGLGSQFIFYAGLGSEDLEEGGLVPMFDSFEGKEYINRGIGYIPPHDDAISILVDVAMATLTDLQAVLDDVNGALEGREDSPLGQAVVNVRDITGSLAQATGDLAGGTTVESLEAALASLAGTLDHVEKSVAVLPGQMPQILALVAELRSTLRTADDVLTGLKNNPLLRNGIPDHVETDVSGTSPRNISF